MTKKARLFKGTRDFLPQEARLREYVIAKMREVFRRFGFEPLETPALEHWETLTGKYGPEGENLIYRLDYKGGYEVALRYDLTIPLCRVIAMNPDIPMPFRRYQIQPVWRADKPQIAKGRFREFYQCDVDIVGTKSIAADAEVIAAGYEVMKALGFKDFTVRINHRQLLEGIMESVGIGKETLLVESRFGETRVPVSKNFLLMRALDKYSVVGRGGVEEQLSDYGFEPTEIKKLAPFFEFNEDQDMPAMLTNLMSGSATGIGAVIGLDGLICQLQDVYSIPAANLRFDRLLSRGLDYYTGIVFETEVPGIQIGSVAGGGRYDHLIGELTGIDLPATGNAFGLDRIITAITSLSLFPETRFGTDVMIVTVPFGSTDGREIAKAQEAKPKLAKVLRENDISVEFFFDDDQPDLRDQLGYASKRGIILALIVGPDELEKETIQLRNLRTKTQREVPLADVIKEVQSELEKLQGSQGRV